MLSGSGGGGCLSEIYSLFRKAIPDPRLMTKGEMLMLQNVSEMHGLKIHATDGEIGSVDQWFFDDRTWTIRYLVVDTGTWLPGKQVLISPTALGETEWFADAIHVSLTKEQIENSPGIDADKPVSREHEAEHVDRYGYAHYWRGRPDEGASPADRLRVTGQAARNKREPGSTLPEEQGDPHLRSTKEVVGYYIEARDGDIGHVEDFLVDPATWSIKYMVVDTNNWWPGKKALVATQWIERVSWEMTRVYVDLTQEIIKHAPEYNAETLVNRKYEDSLYEHYGRTKYWVEEIP